MRGIHAVDARTIWASGAKGTVLLSTDAGRNWQTTQVPGADQLDFRSVYAFSAHDAYVLSSGDAEKSKLFHTEDSGRRWTLLYTAKEGFLDGLKFWDHQNGIILGDVVGDSFTILTTTDAGQTWQRQNLPPALPGEGAFAASNSSLVVRGKQEVWFATSGARVFHSGDGGRNWNVAQTPVRHDSKTSGIFSLFFPDATHGIAVGGDYSKPTEDSHTIAVTTDAGRTWEEPASRPRGYRSAVACIQHMCIATGPSGSDMSTDQGLTWKALSDPGLHALTVAGDAIFGSGPDGHLERLGH